MNLPLAGHFSNCAASHGAAGKAERNSGVLDNAIGLGASTSFCGASTATIARLYAILEDELGSVVGFIAGERLAWRERGVTVVAGLAPVVSGTGLRELAGLKKLAAQPALPPGRVAKVLPAPRTRVVYDPRVERFRDVRTVRLTNPFRTEPNRALFWSGRTGEVMAESVATDMAQAGGGVTLEQVVRELGVELPP